MNDSDEFSKILDLYINRDKINHAYLIETNRDNRVELAYLLIEKILNLKEKNITIDDLYTNDDLYLIRTDNQIIKKEEIINLKDEFSTKSVYSGKRIYIIEEAEKLNNSSANTLLKFLEEPDEDIIAILITSNKYSIIETILSRCQTIRYYTKTDKKIELPEYFENIVDFVIKLNKEKEKTIGYINYYFNKDLFDRKTFKDILSNMLYIYYDVLQSKVGLDLVYTNEYKDKINELANNMDYDSLNKCITSVNNAIVKLKYNANAKLVLDCLIIDSVGGIDNV